MTKAWLAIVMMTTAVFVISAAAITTFFYFSLSEECLIRSAGAVIGRRLPWARFALNKLLLLPDETVLFSLKLFNPKEIVFFSEEEVVNLQSLLKDTDHGEFDSTELAILKAMWGKISDRRFWLPQPENSRELWLKSAGELRRLKSQNSKLLTEMTKRRVSVLIIREIKDRRVCGIEFQNEVMFPVRLTEIKIIADSQKSYYLIVKGKSQPLRFAEGLVGEYSFSGEDIDEHTGMSLMGDISDIDDIQFTFRNEITSEIFTPRAVRFIDPIGGL